MTFYGWDGSDFDLGRGPVDVEQMVRDLGNPCFVTHKATEGTGVRHGNYGNVINRARAAGATFVGAYVVPRTPANNGNGSIAEQVDYLLAYLDEQTPGWRTWGDFFIQVDLEHWSANGTVYDAVTPVHGVTMADLVEQRTGKRAVLYAPAWAYGDTIGGSHPLWASNYGANPAVHFRAAYPGDQSPRWAGYSGRTPAILQYGSRLTIGGQPTCDANAYRGTVDQFRTMIGSNGGDMATAEEIAKAVWDYPIGANDIAGDRRQPAGNLLKDSADMLNNGSSSYDGRVGAVPQALIDIRAAAGKPVTVTLAPDQFAALKADLLAMWLPKPPTAGEVAEELAKRLGNG